LNFYGYLFDFKSRRKNEKMAFIDLGDQFAPPKGRSRPTMAAISVLLWTIKAARRALQAAGITPIGGPFLDLSFAEKMPPGVQSLLMRD
jgi:hypothetical protein